MPKIKIVCKECKTEFYDYASNNKIFCSRECHYINKKKDPNNVGWWLKRGIENPGIIGGIKCRFKIGNIPWFIRKRVINPTKLPEIREKKRKSMIGKLAKERNPNWKGGISKLRDKLKETTEYKEWMNKVLERDDYTCQMCGKRGGKLNVHHIIPYYNESSLITNLSNGTTLCAHPCHSSLNGKEIEKALEYGWLNLNQVFKYIKEPKIIDGGIFYNDMGSIKFVNNFNFKEFGIKRFYQISNFNTKIKKAFHGHFHEIKVVWVAHGAIKLICAPMQNKSKLRKNKIFTYVLGSNKPQLVIIPKGYANGFKALEDGTIVMFFSTSTLEESKNDDYRFPWDSVGEEIWKTKNR